MQLKIKAGTDLLKYGFTQYKKQPHKYYINCTKGDLTIAVEVDNLVLTFYAQIEAAGPDLDTYYDSETRELNMSTFTDDYDQITNQHENIQDFADLLALLISDNVLEVAHPVLL